MLSVENTNTAWLTWGYLVMILSLFYDVLTSKYTHIFLVSVQTYENTFIDLIHHGHSDGSLSEIAVIINGTRRYLLPVPRFLQVQVAFNYFKPCPRLSLC